MSPSRCDEMGFVAGTHQVGDRENAPARAARSPRRRWPRARPMAIPCCWARWAPSPSLRRGSPSCPMTGARPGGLVPCVSADLVFVASGLAAAEPGRSGGVDQGPRRQDQTRDPGSRLAGAFRRRSVRIRPALRCSRCSSRKPSAGPRWSRPAASREIELGRRSRRMLAYGDGRASAAAGSLPRRRLGLVRDRIRMTTLPRPVRAGAVRSGIGGLSASARESAPAATDDCLVATCWAAAQMPRGSYWWATAQAARATVTLGIHHQCAHPEASARHPVARPDSIAQEFSAALADT